jgi:hypothetical protein
LGSVPVGSVTHFATPATGGGRIFVPATTAIEAFNFANPWSSSPTVNAPASPATTKFTLTINATSAATLSSFDLIQYDSTLSVGWFDVASGIRAVSAGANTWTATASVNGYPSYSYKFEARGWTYDGSPSSWGPAASTTVSNTATFSHQFKGLYTLKADGFARADASPPLASSAFSPGSTFAVGVEAYPGASSPQSGAVLGSNGWLYPYGAGIVGAGALTFGGLRYSASDTARDFAFMPDGTGGYVLDKYGNLTPFGINGHAAPPAAQGNPLWSADVARKVVIFSDGTGGYVLDYTGVPNPFGVGRPPPAPPQPSKYWPDQDFARDLVLIPGTHDGYVMNGWGGLYPFRVGADAYPYVPAGYPYWPYHDIARGVWLLPSSTSSSPGGYVMDCNGGLSQFGTAAPSDSPTPDWSSCYLAADLTG